MQYLSVSISLSVISLALLVFFVILGKKTSDFKNFDISYSYQNNPLYDSRLGVHGSKSLFVFFLFCLAQVCLIACFYFLTGWNVQKNPIDNFKLLESDSWNFINVEDLSEDHRRYFYKYDSVDIVIDVKNDEKISMNGDLSDLKEWTQIDKDISKYSVISGAKLFTVWKDGLNPIPRSKLELIKTAPNGILQGIYDGMVFSVGKIFQKFGIRIKYIDEVLFKTDNNGLSYKIGFFAGLIIESIVQIILLVWFIIILINKIKIHKIRKKIKQYNEDEHYDYVYSLINEKINSYESNANFELCYLEQNKEDLDTQYNDKKSFYNDSTPIGAVEEFISLSRNERRKLTTKKNNRGFFSTLLDTHEDTVKLEQDLFQKLSDILDYYNLHVLIQENELKQQIVIYNKLRKQSCLYLELIKEIQSNLTVKQREEIELSNYIDDTKDDFHNNEISVYEITSEIDSFKESEFYNNVISFSKDISSLGFRYMKASGMKNKLVGGGIALAGAAMGIGIEIIGAKFQNEELANEFKKKENHILENNIPKLNEQIKAYDVNIKRIMEVNTSIVEGLKVFNTVYNDIDNTLFKSDPEKNRTARKERELQGESYYDDGELKFVAEFKPYAKMLSKIIDQEIK